MQGNWKVNLRLMLFFGQSKSQYPKNPVCIFAWFTCVPVNEFCDELDVEHDVGHDQEREQDVDNGDATLNAENGEEKQEINDDGDGDEEGEDDTKDDDFHRFLIRVATKILEGFQEALFKEFIIGWEPVSIVHYTKPQSSI